jgi:hypothetical protein
MPNMARFITNVPRYRPPPLEANPYKLSDRLSRFSNIRLKLDDEGFERLEGGLIQATMVYYARAEATDSKELTQTLDRFSAELTTIIEALGYQPDKYEAYPSLNDDIAFLAQNELGWESLRECVKYLKITKEGVGKASAKVTGTVTVKGRKDYVWYDIFVDIMRFAAEKSNISLSVQDRVSPKRRTPFLGLVGAYEMCLPRGMRSLNRQARAKRIVTSLKRFAFNRRQ